jgi:hypothetical protein
VLIAGVLWSAFVEPVWIGWLGVALGLVMVLLRRR